MLRTKKASVSRFLRGWLAMLEERLCCGMVTDRRQACPGRPGSAIVREAGVTTESSCGGGGPTHAILHKSGRPARGRRTSEEPVRESNGSWQLKTAGST